MKEKSRVYPMNSRVKGTFYFFAMVLYSANTLITLVINVIKAKKKCSSLIASIATIKPKQIEIINAIITDLFGQIE